jgi:U3 small nucleolar RNA-associated protein 18
MNASGSHQILNTTTNESDVESGLDDEAEQDDASDNDDEDDSTKTFPSPPSPSGSSTTLDHPPKPSQTQKRPKATTSAWQDPDDSTLKVSLLSNRLRKLRDGPGEEEVDGKDYERRLRRQFERINPTPEWARKHKHKRQKVGDGDNDDNDGDDDVANLLSSTGGVLAGVEVTRHKTITQGSVDIERLRDANQAARAEGRIESVQFHPSPQVPVMVTASADRRARLFTVSTLR